MAKTDPVKLLMTVHLPGGDSWTLRFSQWSWQVRIGSDPQCEVVVPAPNVAPIHAEIRTTPNGVYIVDRSGGNTMFGGQAIETAALPYDRTVSIALRNTGVRIDLHSWVSEPPQQPTAGLQRKAPHGPPDVRAPDPVIGEPETPQFDSPPQEPGPGGRVKVTVLSRAYREDFFVSSGNQATIGRARGCEIRLPENTEEVSGKHARLSWLNGWLILEDLGSVNGTMFHGRGVERVVLRPSETHQVELARGVASLTIRVTPTADRRSNNRRDDENARDEDSASSSEDVAQIEAWVNEERQHAKQLAAEKSSTTNASGKESRDTARWVDLPASSKGQVPPRDNSVLAIALATMARNPAGATLAEIKQAFNAVGMGHHDPKRVLVWGSRKRGWGFVMTRETDRIKAVSTLGDVAARDDYDGEVVAKQLAEEQANDKAARESFERAKSEFDEQRRLFEEERRRFDEERRRGDFSDDPITDPTLPTIVLPEPGMEWLVELPDEVRELFRHLAGYGQVNEEEATRMLGGARQFRRFSMEFDSFRARIPFAVRIETAGGVKCYVRGER